MTEEDRKTACLGGTTYALSFGVLARASTSTRTNTHTHTHTYTHAYQGV